VSQQQRNRSPVPRSRHPVNQAMYDQAPLGARIADAVTGFMGSWRFIILQTVIVVAWISGNVYLLFHYDPYPFILLNLAFSTQAAYACASDPAGRQPFGEARSSHPGACRRGRGCRGEAER
jgi:uncharacterized membrane protein